MASAQPVIPETDPHIPVLLEPILERLAPVKGRWLDGTFGAGGYSRALLEAGASQLLAVDQDPEVFELASGWVSDFSDRLFLAQGQFADMEALAGDRDMLPLDGVILDIGVSSMQFDEAGRGFSFMRDGPLDMRMAQVGITAAEIVNGASESMLADILFHYGEERASRRIARNIVKARLQQPIATTRQLAEIVERSLPRPKKGQSHPATRTFQALRIAVNDELGQLVSALEAAEHCLAEGGMLAVVSFHSLEDRIVKRFMASRSSAQAGTNRYAPAEIRPDPSFTLVTRKAVEPTPKELALNPRARSARLRIARRTGAPAQAVDAKAVGLPAIDLKKVI